MKASSDALLPARLAEALGDAYTIEGEVGRGGMGVVYRARDERLQRRVAIKVLPPELAYQQEIRERFTREAQTAARLSHPHIVPIHSVGEGAGLVYFVMGYVEGESVAARVKRRGQLPVEEARRIMRETADALSAAHALSIIHRDIKPDNILLEGTRGRVMVTDFGIAKALSAASGATLTGAGVAIGTPAFMSPEQAAGEREIDGRSDIYSLGVVAYLMLTGELPFTAPTVAGILMKQITELAPDVSRKRSDVPEDLALAVSRCLEKDPENRWPTADALRRSLESRSTAGYRPTGTGRRGARAAPATDKASGQPALERPPEPVPGAAPRVGHPPPMRRRGTAEAAPSRRADRHPADRHQRDETPLPDSGEPKIIQRVRGQFASWAATSIGLFGINVVTNGLDFPWFLFPTIGIGIGVLKNYGKLWQAGYSWRDVMSRPAAPDAVEMTMIRAGRLPRQIAAPTASEFGEQLAAVQQVHTDRQAILRLIERLQPAERRALPEIYETADGLYRRALDLARTLHALDSDMSPESPVQIDDRIAALEHEMESPDRSRRLGLLERQRKALTELRSRRSQVAGHLESCVLAMQNLRLDLLKLRSANLNEVLADITQATQQARALSLSVDNAIAAAGEVRDALK